MNLPELRMLLESTGLPVTYLQWPEGMAPEPPRISYYADEDVFLADDIVYQRGYAVTIELYTERKDLTLEGKISDLLTENKIAYKPYESELKEEKMYLKAYEINI